MKSPVIGLPVFFPPFFSDLCCSVSMSDFIYLCCICKWGGTERTKNQSGGPGKTEINTGGSIRGFLWYLIFTTKFIICITIV